MTLKISTLFFAFFTVAATGFAQVNLSGNWIINPQKSEFDGVPAYAYHHQMKIRQSNGIMNIESEGTDQNGKAYNSGSKISLDGKEIKRIIQDSIQLITSYTWAADNKTLVKNQSFSIVNNEQPYRTIQEKWSLSADGKELIIEQTVAIKNSDGYSIKAVFDKQ